MGLRGRFTVVRRRRRRREGRCGGEAMGEEWHYRKSVGFGIILITLDSEGFLDLSMCFSDGGVRI